MSEWYEAKKEEIEVTETTVNIFVKQNDWGSVYVTLTFDQIRDIYKQLEEE